MCNIWNEESGDDLDISLIGSLPRTLRHVNISGGEPFLRKDLTEVVIAVRQVCPDAAIIISTNGLVKRTRETVSTIRRSDPDIGLALSVDGIGVTHDRIRGIPGAFDKAMALIRALKEDGMTNLRLAFTVYDDNVSEYSRVYELSRELGVEFTSAVAQGSTHYFRSTGVKNLDPAQLKAQFEKVAAAELKSFSPKRWARAYFNRGLYLFARGSGRPLNCRAADDFFFLGPDGSVYACNVLDLPLGNLGQSSFEEIWFSKAARAAREKVAGCDMSCWMICTARSAIRRNPLRVAGWVAAGKMKATLGKPVL